MVINNQDLHEESFGVATFFYISILRHKTCGRCMVCIPRTGDVSADLVWCTVQNGTRDTQDEKLRT